MRIQHNIMAMNAYRNYTNNNKALSGNLEKLSSGYKINRAGDDAAGLAISEKMRAQITGLNAAQKNVKDGVSLVKTAEGAMQEIHDMLNRMDYLATQSANGTYDNEVDRLNLQKEVASLKTEINRIADSANFNGIKLLDGSLDVNGEMSITTAAPATENHAGVDGITVGDAEQGGGTKGSFTISIDKLFGNKDAMTITWDQGSGFDAAKSEGATESTALKAAATTLTFGTDFEGATTAEQAASIAEKLNSDANVAAQFDVKSEGNKVILTNKIEGNDQATVSKVETKDAAGTANKQATVTKTPTDGTDGTNSVYDFANLFKANGGMEFENGDVLTFKITDANGNDWTAKMTLTDDIIGADDKTTHDNIMAKLNDATAAGAVYFEPNDKTVAAEESIKFSDLFGAASADGNKLTLTAKDNGGIFVNGNMTISSSNKKVTDVTVAGTTGVAGANGAKYSVKLTSAAGDDNNYSIGDTLKIEGKLSDQRTFEVTLEAGKDFEVGATEEETVKNIATALAKGKDTIEVKDADGNIENVALNKIFSDTAGKNEIMVKYDGTDKLQFTSQVENDDTFAASITGVTYTAADTGAVSTDLRNGVQKTAASSSVSFDALEEGATVKVGDKTYQFVTDAAKADAGNTAVVVDDLTNGESIAKALADQLTKDAGDTDPAYTVEQDGNKVTITTTAKGSDVAAPAIESGTPSHEDVVFELQPNKLKAGSSITVNGKTFEFIDTAKDKDAKAAEGNIAIDVDMVKGDKEVINQAMVDALTKEGFEARLEDGKVKICNDGEEKIEVSFNNGKALTLQIGDTSDSFNQLAVSVGDMHTWAMGIDGIDISTQEGAQGAIDYVKSAINYVSGVRGDLGAIQNRLEHTGNNLSVMAENIQDAESTIRDTDVAEEMMSYVKNNILVQSAQAMLAQANQVPQGVLQLLG